MAAPRHDWYLKEWLAALSKKQADIVKDLGWNKAKVSLMIRGMQPYTREEINELAEYLNIRPHELLMHPEDAHAIRRLRADMIRLAHETEEAEHQEPQKKVAMLYLTYPSSPARESAWQANSHPLTSTTKTRRFPT